MELQQLAAKFCVFALDVFNATDVAGNGLQQLPHGFAAVSATGLQIVFLGLGLRLELDEGVVGRKPWSVVSLFLDLGGHDPAVRELLLLVAADGLAGLCERRHDVGILSVV